MLFLIEAMRMTMLSLSGRRKASCRLRRLRVRATNQSNKIILDREVTLNASIDCSHTYAHWTTSYSCFYIGSKLFRYPPMWNWCSFFVRRFSSFLLDAQISQIDWFARWGGSRWSWEMGSMGWNGWVWVVVSRV